MAFSISGTVYTDAGITPMGSGRTVAVSVNGGAISITTTTASDGTFTLPLVVSATSAPVTVFLQGNTEKGVALLQVTGGTTNVTGVRLYQDALVFQRPSGTSGSLSGANINTSDNSGDSDIAAIYSSSSSTLYTMAAGKNIYALDNATVGTGATINGGIVDFSGSSSSQNVNLTFIASGTIFGRSSTTPAAGNLTINCSGNTVSLGNAIRVTNVILTSGTLDVSVSNYALTASSWTATNGLLNPRSGLVSLSGTSSLSTNNQPFYNLQLTGIGTQTLSTTGLTVTNSLTIDATKTLDVSVSNFNVTVGGNWSNSGTFTARSGTVTFNGTSQVISGTTTFYNLVANTSGDVISFTDGTTTTISNSVTFQNVTLQGTSTAGWTIAMPATQTIDHVTVSYSTATGNTAVAGTGSVNAGNNTNWTFGSVTITGSSTVTLANLTFSSSGTLTILGTSNITLGSLSQVSTGSLNIVGASNVTLDTLLQSSTGTITTLGVSNTVLDSLSQASTGSLSLLGSSTTALDNLTQVSNVSLIIVGNSTTVLQNLISSATGSVLINDKITTHVSLTSLISGNISSKALMSGIVSISPLISGSVRINPNIE